MCLSCASNLLPTSSRPRIRLYFSHLLATLCSLLWIQESSVDVATGHWLDGRGSISGKGKRCSLLCSAQTCSEAHPASFPKGIGDSLGTKLPGLETKHSLPSSAAVKNCGAIFHYPIRLHGMVLNYEAEGESCLRSLHVCYRPLWHLVNYLTFEASQY
jgi:hypothetical protein